MYLRLNIVSLDLQLFPGFYLLELMFPELQ